MAFHGDLSSYPLPDLLQWIDSSRKTGALLLSWDAGSRKLFVLAGQVVATATAGLWERLARVLEAGSEAPGERVMASLRSGRVTDASVDIAARQLAEDDLIGALVDLTQAQGGRFHWTEDPDRGDDEWVPLTLPLRHALFESLRYIDEAEEVERVLPRDTLVVRAGGGLVPPTALHRVIVHIATRESGAQLGRLWLQLGLTRGVVLRAVYELLKAGRVRVDGAAELGEDPIAEMLEKGAVLLRERQFDAAGLVFSALLQRDPGDRRVREFVLLAEREHVAALYRDLPPVTTFEVVRSVEAFQGLRPEERQLAAQLETGWDLSSVVLASPHRELDALRSVHKLVRMGVLVPRAT